LSARASSKRRWRPFFTCGSRSSTCWTEAIVAPAPRQEPGSLLTDRLGRVPE
jgi:hypothetical protein